MVVGSLGKVIFVCSSYYIKTFSNFSKDKSFEWTEHKIINSKSKLQFNGPELENIKFNIILDAAFNVNPTAAAKELMEYGDTGTVLKLIVGTQVLGDYVITSISEQHKLHTAMGHVRKIDLSISLKEYN